MTARKGDKAKIKKDGVVICAGINQKDVNIGAELIDDTANSNRGFSVSLADVDTKSITLGFSGIAKSRMLRKYRLEDENLLVGITYEFANGDTITGSFIISDYSESGSVGDAIKFNCSLRSSGAYAYAFSVSEDDGGDVTEPLELLAYEQTFTQQYSKTDFSPLGVQLLDEQFTSDAGQLLVTTEGTVGTVTFSSGQLSISGSGARNTIIRTGDDIEIPVVWAEVNVISRTSLGSGYNNTGVGIAKDSNNFIYASFDQMANQRRVQVKIAGTNVFYSSASYTFPASAKIAMSLVMNSVSVWVDSGSGWSCLVTHAVPTATVNMGTLDFTGWKTSFTVAASATVTWVFDSLKSGIFGGVGIRDMSLVAHQNGAPVDFSGKYRFTATSTCPVGTGYNSVWQYDPSDYTIEMIGAIITERSGVKYNDLNGHIVKNDDDTYRIVNASWGNGFGGVLQCYHKNNIGDIMVGSNILVSPSQLTLPLIPGSGSGGAYDPYLIHDGVRWVIAYAVVDDTDFVGENFYIALAESADMSSFSAIGDDSSRTIVEGPKICTHNGDIFIYSGGRGEQPCYDVDMNYVGGATFSPALYVGTDTQPHTMIFPHDEEYHCITWNNVKFGSAPFTWGDYLCYTAPRFS